MPAPAVERPAAPVLGTAADPATATRPPLRARDVVVGCLVDEAPRFRAEALRLLQSIRWFGGELAGARVVVCVVGEVARDFLEACATLGADIRQVERFPVPNGSANRLQMFARLWDADCELLLLLDCDTLVVGDPLPLLRRNVFQAKIAPLPTVTMPALARAFAHFGVPLPAPVYTHRFTGEPTIAYCNAGVIVTPRPLLRELEAFWRYYNTRLFERIELIHPCERHVHQASLSLALAISAVPFAAVDDALNFQLNQDWLPTPPGFAEIDPLIIHYHDRVDAGGFVRRCPYPGAQARIDAFNERRRIAQAAPRDRPARRLSVPAAPSPGQVLVLGMHRSGTSALTSLLDAMGLSAGGGEEFNHADSHNPRGYREHCEVRALDEEILATLGRSWAEPLDLDLGTLPAEKRRELDARARAVADRLDERGIRVIKDPRLCLLFPFWRPAFERPACVLVHRQPLAVARSLAAREGLPLPVGVALWEVYYLSALASTRGLPRLLMNFEELVADPGAAARRLRAWLVAAGVGDAAETREFCEAEARAIVDRSRVHQDGTPAEEPDLLAPEQQALCAALRNGSALDLDSLPEPSAAARAVLRVHAQSSRVASALRTEREEAWQEHARRAHQYAEERQGRVAVALGALASERRHGDELAAREAAHREELTASEAAHRGAAAERDRLLGAVFSSRTWRWGFAAGAVLRRLRPRRGPTVEERWRQL